jgi:hypothetical protein
VEKKIIKNYNYIKGWDLVLTLFFPIFGGKFMKMAKILVLAVIIQCITLTGAFGGGSKEDPKLAENTKKIEELDKKMTDMQIAFDEQPEAITKEDVRNIVREELQQYNARPLTDSSAGDNIAVENNDTDYEITEEENPEPDIYAEQPEDQPSDQSSPLIAGKGTLEKDVIVNYIISKGSKMRRGEIEDIVTLYINEANDEGINYDIAIAQMCYATRYLNDGARLRTFNYGGLSDDQGISVSGWEKHANATEGVRAHIQHLKGYTSAEKPSKEIVNRRYAILERNGMLGTVQTLDALFPKWSPLNAVKYGEGIKGILEEMYKL